MLYIKLDFFYLHFIKLQLMAVSHYHSPFCSENLWLRKQVLLCKAAGAQCADLSWCSWLPALSQHIMSFCQGKHRAEGGRPGFCFEPCKHQWHWDPVTQNMQLWYSVQILTYFRVWAWETAVPAAVEILLVEICDRKWSVQLTEKTSLNCHVDSFLVWYNGSVLTLQYFALQESRR